MGKAKWELEESEYFIDPQIRNFGQTLKIFVGSHVDIFYWAVTCSALGV
jgi:hypothetical protein